MSESALSSARKHMCMAICMALEKYDGPIQFPALDDSSAWGTNNTTHKPTLSRHTHQFEACFELEITSLLLIVDAMRQTFRLSMYMKGFEQVCCAGDGTLVPCDIVGISEEKRNAYRCRKTFVSVNNILWFDGNLRIVHQQLFWQCIESDLIEPNWCNSCNHMDIFCKPCMRMLPFFVQAPWSLQC